MKEVHRKQTDKGNLPSKLRQITNFKWRNFNLFECFILVMILVVCIGVYVADSNKQSPNSRINYLPNNTNYNVKTRISLTPTIPQLKNAESSEVNGTLAFISEGEIWTVNSDGTNLKQITTDENNKFQISISSDGKKIAYGFYPKNPEKRTNNGDYVGFYNGLAILDTVTNSKKIVIPYERIQNHYPVWSSDNKYLSVWVGNGTGSRLIDVSTGNNILTLTGNDESYVSPIVWIPSTGKVSFIENNTLILSNIDGSDRQTIATGVDALRQVHEGPNVPQPPLWSPSGRYVSIYKNGDLHLIDSINNTDVLIQKGEKSEISGQIYPQAYPLAFNDSESKLYLYDATKKNDTIVLNIQTGEIQELADLGQSAVVSPDKRKLIGQTFDKFQKNMIIDLTTNSQKECLGAFDYYYYSWAGGTGYTFRYDTWSPDNKGIIGYRNYGRQGLSILNIQNCTVFNIDTANYKVDDAVWIP